MSLNVNFLAGASSKFVQISCVRQRMRLIDYSWSSVMIFNGEFWLSKPFSLEAANCWQACEVDKIGQDFVSIRQTTATEISWWIRLLVF